MKISVIIPVYNEKELILEIVNRVLKAPIPEGWNREVVIVDDGSDDGTSKMLSSAQFPENVIVFNSIINHGKGAAVRAGFRISTGDIFIIQDGDLEYDPMINYLPLLNPFRDSNVRVVYGSRFLSRTFPEGMKIFNFIANKILTYMVKLLYNCRITDEATAYKVFRSEVLDDINLECRRFEFCPEVTSKILKKGEKIVEVPIIYKGRNQFQGKKIKFWDGIVAFYTLLKYRFVN